MSAPVRTEARRLYGEAGDALADDLLRVAAAFREAHPAPAVPPAERMSERDALLITYADALRRDGEAPLRTLRTWLEGPLADTVSTVHVLPFHPWSSDDGFAVKSYDQVDPRYGTWRDVEGLAAHHRLMVDAVVNHASAQGDWFAAYLRGDAPQRTWFRSEAPDADVRGVVRPRTTPLLTKFDAHDGDRWVWTTFGPDQVDLDYRDPTLLREIVSVLLAYVEHGARVLRLDAVTYLWKELGTPCAHHPHTHGLIRLLRAVLEVAAPYVVVLTETNVPHAENVAYFGSGDDEAQMVYNFALPPLVLHTMTSGDVGPLRTWAADLRTPSDATWFLNFLASHDGIGVRAVESILPPDAIDRLVERTLALGGQVGRKRDADGRETPYELNVGYLDALRTPGVEEPLEREVARFAAAHAVMMALPGVPALYLHSLLGSRGAPDLARATGTPRAINRAKLDADATLRELEDPTSRRARIRSALHHLLRTRRTHPAFHPNAPHAILDAPPGVLTLRRGDDAPVTAVHELAGRDARVVLPAGLDLLTGERRQAGPHDLAPYEVRWIAEAGP